jgi:cullin 1
MLQRIKESVLAILASPPTSAKTTSTLAMTVYKIMNHQNSAPQMQLPRRLTYIQQYYPDQFPKEPQSLQAHVLYFHLEEIITQHVTQTILPKVTGHDVELLTNYVDQFEKFEMSLVVLKAIFHYLNQWIKTQSHAQQMFDTTVMAIAVWRDYLYTAQKELIINSLLNLVAADREKIAVDYGAMKRTLSSLISMNVDTKRPYLFYSAQFESQFFSCTERYYSAYADANVNSCSLSEYLRRAEGRIKEELRRVGLYLEKNTGPGLKKILVMTLVDSRIEYLVSQVVEWIDLGIHDDLHRLHNLLTMSATGLEPLRRIVEDRIDADGKSECEKLAMEPVKDPSAFIEVVVRVYRKYAKLVHEVFSNNQQLTLALEKGGNRFLNKNAICPSSSVAAEMLAKHCNAVLRPNTNANKDADCNMDAALDDIITVFRLLDDRDVFQSVYASLLSGRLIYNTYNEENELAMIGKLKDVLGHEYTYKFQRMCVDAISAAHSNHEQFTAWLQKNHPSEKDIANEFTAFPLTQGSWPTVSNSTLPPPAPLRRHYALFEMFYHAKHSGRKLEWIPMYSHGSVKTNFPLPRGRHYEFIISAVQLPVLLAYNDADSLVMPQIVSLCCGDAAAANRVIQSLVRVKIVNQADESGGPVYSLNMQFMSQQKKLAIHLVREVQNTNAEQAAQQTKTEDRKYAIQAAIVRLAKSRKVIQHQEVITGVIGLLSSRFTPTIADIKVNIETLIEKEYLERTAQDASVYQYLA